MKVFTIESDGTTFYAAALSDVISQIPDESDLEVGEDYIIGCCEMKKETLLKLPEFEGF